MLRRRKKKKGYKSLYKKERFKIMEGFFLGIILGTHRGSYRMHMDILFGKSLCFFSLFFLIYTKHSLKSRGRGGAQCLLPISSFVAEWKMDRKLTQW